MDLLVLPQFLGMLLLLGTAAVLALALLVALWAAVSRNRAVLRRALLVGLGMAGIYLLFWLGGLALTRRGGPAPRRRAGGRPPHAPPSSPPRRSRCCPCRCGGPRGGWRCLRWAPASPPPAPAPRPRPAPPGGRR